MASTRTIASLLALGLAAAGCGPAGRDHVNTSLYSVHQPVVQRTDFVLDLATSPGGVPDSELVRLGAWFDSLGVGYGDRIFVEEPQGYGAPRAREAIASVAGRRGLLVNQAAPLTAGQVQPGSVRVVVARMTASVPGCPAASSFDTGGHSATSLGFGCAINSNIAAMIADPNDLVLGQTGSSQADPARAIRTYRDQPQTGTRGLPATQTTGNNR